MNQKSLSRTRNSTVQREERGGPAERSLTAAAAEDGQLALQDHAAPPERG